MTSVTPSLFRKFFQRDKADTVIFDVDLLSALTAGLVGCFHIDRLYQFSQHTRVDFLDVHVFVCRSDEPFNIFVLSFLYFNLLPQSDNLCFKLFLFRFVAV